MRQLRVSLVCLSVVPAKSAPSRLARTGAAQQGAHVEVLATASRLLPWLRRGRTRPPDETVEEEAPGAGPGRAKAEGQRAPTEAPDDGGPEPAGDPAADSLSGHFQLTPGWCRPLGSPRANAPQSDAMGAGWAFGAMPLTASVAPSPSARSAIPSLGSPARRSNARPAAWRCAFVRATWFRRPLRSWMLAGLGYRTTNLSGAGNLMYRHSGPPPWRRRVRLRQGRLGRIRARHGYYSSHPVIWARPRPGTSRPAPASPSISGQVAAPPGWRGTRPPCAQPTAIPRAFRSCA
jgi:hypothetical protein